MKIGKLYKNLFSGFNRKYVKNIPVWGMLGLVLTGSGAAANEKTSKWDSSSLYYQLFLENPKMLDVKIIDIPYFEPVTREPLDNKLPKNINNRIKRLSMEPGLENENINRVGSEILTQAWKRGGNKIKSSTRPELSYMSELYAEGLAIGALDDYIKGNLSGLSNGYDKSKWKAEGGIYSYFMTLLQGYSVYKNAFKYNTSSWNQIRMFLLNSLAFNLGEIEHLGYWASVIGTSKRDWRGQRTGYVFAPYKNKWYPKDPKGKNDAPWMDTYTLIGQYTQWKRNRKGVMKNDIFEALGLASALYVTLMPHGKFEEKESYSNWPQFSIVPYMDFKGNPEITNPDGQKVKLGAPGLNNIREAVQLKLPLINSEIRFYNNEKAVPCATLYTNIGKFSLRLDYKSKVPPWGAAEVNISPAIIGKKEIIEMGITIKNSEKVSKGYFSIAKSF